MVLLSSFLLKKKQQKNNKKENNRNVILSIAKNLNTQTNAFQISSLRSE